MRLNKLFLSGCVSGAVAVFVVPAMASTVHECVASKPTAASYTWNFKREADAIFSKVQADAKLAEHHADEVQSFARRTDISWETNVYQLDALKKEVNDMGAKLCRLETIRRVLAPWQQAEVDRIAKRMQLISDNTQDAILFMDAHTHQLWLPGYEKYAHNIYDEAAKLAHSTGKAVAYARVSKEYRTLTPAAGMPAGS